MSVSSTTAKPFFTVNRVTYESSPRVESALVIKPAGSASVIACLINSVPILYLCAPGAASFGVPEALSSKSSRDILLHSWCFGEDQGRIIVATNDLDKVKLFLNKNSIDYYTLGKVNSTSNLNVKNITTISIKDIKDLYENTLSSIMSN